MSGHSKFANIKHKKEKNDAAKGKIFTIIGREIAIAVKEGGPDPSNNSKLRDVIAKAKANNMPNDTIDRGIKKAAGSADAVNYESVTYEGVGATKKWERLESYGPKFVENIVQAISRDILCYAMQRLSYCFIVGHIHDEIIIECSNEMSLEKVCEQMGETPPWIKGLLLRADGYECEFYKKD